MRLNYSIDNISLKAYLERALERIELVTRPALHIQPARFCVDCLMLVSTTSCSAKDQTWSDLVSQKSKLYVESCSIRCQSKYLELEMAYLVRPC